MFDVVHNTAPQYLKTCLHSAVTNDWDCQHVVTLLSNKQELSLVSMFSLVTACWSHSMEFVSCLSNRHMDTSIFAGSWKHIYLVNYRQKTVGIEMTFIDLYRLGSNLAFDFNLEIFGQKTPTITNFCHFFTPQGWLCQLIFLKCAEFMCSYSPYIRLKFCEIRFINNQKTAHWLFHPKVLWAPSPKTSSWIQKQLSTKMVRTSSIHMPGLVEIGLCSPWHEIENKEFLCFFFVCLSRWAWPILVSQSCHRDVWHFNEVQLRHFRFSHSLRHF